LAFCVGYLLIGNKMKSALFAVLVALSLVACGQKAADVSAVAASAAAAAPTIADAASSVAAAASSVAGAAADVAAAAKK
jgi:hypothetical protein